MNQPTSAQPALSRNTIQTAPYTNRPPSPPYIHVPSLVMEGGRVSIVPSFENVDSMQLTVEDLNIITQNKTQIANENTHNWKYESRRLAQPVLDFLYLGPSSVAKDKDFLKREGITMLIAARDARMAEARLMGVHRSAQALNIVTEYIDVADKQQLIQIFPSVVKKINNHLLQVYRSQAVKVAEPEQQAMEGQIAIDKSNFRRGKVLVFCETGNDRSATIVAAYIMSVFGRDLIPTLQFIGAQRFCVSFDEETKQWLQSYDDILRARRMVSRVNNGDDMPRTAAKSGPSKRRIEETMESEDQHTGSSTAESNLDMDRYTDRPRFMPFVDGDVPMHM